MVIRDPIKVEAGKMEIYQLLVEMADRVSQRRQSANSFYLSINTVLAGAFAYAGSTEPSPSTVLIIAVAGVAICSLWLMSISSYRTLNSAKYSVICELEKSLPIQAYTDEWSLLDPDSDGKRHRPFHKVEAIVPWVFGLIYTTQAILLIPWHQWFCN